MIYGTLVGLVFVLSLAYVVLVLANKESGNMKLVGQILTALIVIVALVMLYVGATGRGMHRMMSGCPMMSKDGGSMMDKGMSNGGCAKGDMTKMDMKGTMKKKM